jgi:hypothetical protein
MNNITQTAHCIGHNRGFIDFGAAPMPSTRSAIIFKPAPSAMTSGRRRSKWVLRLERCTARQIEPLMGWTSNDDPLADLELRFDFLASAVRYAERQGLSYRINAIVPALL